MQCGRLARVDKYEELRARVLEGRSDANINFEDLRRLRQVRRVIVRYGLEAEEV